jgi:hypothetical protein
VFPEEWVLEDFSVGVSDSFCSELQWRVTMIDYGIWVEWKPVYGTANPVEYYPWLGDALYIGIDVTDKWPQNAPVPGELVWVGAALPPGAPGTGALKVMQSSLSLDKTDSNNLNDTITIGLDVPVFEGYYNVLTDPTPKPSGLNAPTVVILKSDTDRYFPGNDGVTLGVDLKIQVEDIIDNPNPLP